MINKVSVRHSIKGRTRLKIKGLKKSSPEWTEIENSFADFVGILNIRINKKGSSVILRYDPTLTDETKLKSTIELLIPTEEAGSSCPSTCGCSIDTGNPVKPALFRFAAISAVMGGVFIRTTLLGLTVAETLISPLGIIAVISAVPLIKSSLKSIRNKKFNLEVFLGASIIAAVAAGEALTAFEVLWINSGAELLKAWITERSRKSIASILDATSHHTFILVDGVEVEAEVSSLKKGSVVVLHTGEKVCVDGEIISGEALLDESPISGRMDFIPRGTGESVLAGTFVRQGVIHVRADKVGDETYLARILSLVEDSLANKAPIEQVADKLAATLVKVGFGATAATFLITGSYWRAFTVMLVMACPCATILAASTAVSAALSAAAKKNILIKGGRYLEEAGKIDTVCLDKTGTLTTNEPVLDSIISISEFSEAELLQLAYSVETHNHHPLAQAVKKHAEDKNISPIPHSVCEYYLGMGMRAELEGDEVLIGNKKLMEEYNVALGKTSAKAAPLKKRGLTVLYMAKGRTIVGLLAFDNLIRSESKAVINRLRQNGIRGTVLITGDEKNTASELSRKLGIAECYPSLMPQEKAEIVSNIQAERKTVMMVGDGINDALALAQSDIGVAMGAGGSEVAIEAADIALVNDDLEGLVYVHSLSRETLKVVNQNFWIATGSNLIGVILGAVGALSPVMAGMIHIAHSAGVLANSSRLLNYSPEPLKIESETIETKVS
ncbi:heavy metal translocating P-type ATPase [Maridesulfovibrio bastinii]|uniref:heavy metal translocating P-type ATPase n=1 Tax=Maridesulfovibrio bastinii TaxID=47157 RepID=UPI00041DCF86|nr:cation-translocating P-type ATPase [Maridesulfovibrio bastinii]